MITIRKSNERGFFDHGWLKTYHTFSFGEYQDPNFMGFHSLRVINEDFVAPKKGFPTHPHKNMEILTIVLEGALAHGDSMGHEEIIQAGEVQVMSAGSGIFHNEYNPSHREPAHFLQIWIEPDEQNLAPSYRQKSIQSLLRMNQWLLVAAKGGKKEVLPIRQDVSVYLAELLPGISLVQSMKQGRFGYLHLIRGALEINQIAINQGDGAFIQDVSRIELIASEKSFVVFFDLP